MANLIKVSGRSVRELAQSFHNNVVYKVANDIQLHSNDRDGIEFLAYLLGFQIQYLANIVGHQKIKEIIDEYLNTTQSAAIKPHTDVRH